MGSKPPDPDVARLALSVCPCPSYVVTPIVVALEAARKRGRVGGRPPALSPSQKEEARRMRDEERRPLSEIAALFKVSAKTVRRA